MAESQRRSGRVHDAQRARTTILNAAEVVFATHGFDGARIDAIAAEAGYNKSLIFQYFGDKLNLYGAVLQRADQDANDLRARVFAPLLADATIASDAQRLRRFFETAFAAIFDHLFAHPHLLRIMVWEMAEGWQTYRQVAVPAQIAHAEPIALLFQQAQQAGLLRSAFAPAVQLAMALQICQTYLACLPLYQTVLPDQSLTFDAAFAHGRQYVVDLVVAGIMVDPRST